MQMNIMDMTRMYMHILANSTSADSEFHADFLFIVSSESEGNFSTPKNDWRLIFWAVCSSASSIWPQTHVTWHKVFYFKHTLCMYTTSLNSWKAHYSTSSRSCLLFKKLFTNIWHRPSLHALQVITRTVWKIFLLITVLHKYYKMSSKSRAGY